MAKKIKIEDLAFRLMCLDREIFYLKQKSDRLVQAIQVEKRDVEEYEKKKAKLLRDMKIFAKQTVVTETSEVEKK